MVEVYSNYSKKTKKIIAIFQGLLLLNAWIHLLLLFIANVTFDGEYAVRSRITWLYNICGCNALAAIVAIGIKPFRFFLFFFVVFALAVTARPFITEWTGFLYPGFWHTLW